MLYHLSFMVFFKYAAAVLWNDDFRKIVNFYRFKNILES